MSVFYEEKYIRRRKKSKVNRQNLSLEVVIAASKAFLNLLLMVTKLTSFKTQCGKKFQPF